MLGDRLQAVHVDSHRRLRATRSTSLEHGLVTLVDGGRAEAGSRDLPLLVELRESSVPLGSLFERRVRRAVAVGRAGPPRRSSSHGESVITRDGIWFGADWLRIDRGEDIGHGIIERGQQLDVLRERVEAGGSEPDGTAGRASRKARRASTVSIAPPRPARHDQRAVADARTTARRPRRASGAARRGRRPPRARCVGSAVDIEQQMAHEAGRLQTARERLVRRERCTRRIRSRPRAA